MAPSLSELFQEFDIYQPDNHFYLIVLYGKKTYVIKRIDT
jgi:hypothetical protein